MMTDVFYGDCDIRGPGGLQWCIENSPCQPNECRLIDEDIVLGKLISKGSKVLSHPKRVREIITEVFEDPENPEDILLFHNGVSVPKDKYGPKHIYGGGWVSERFGTINIGI